MPVSDLNVTHDTTRHLFLKIIIQENEVLQRNDQLKAFQVELPLLCMNFLSPVSLTPQGSNGIKMQQ